MARNKQEEEMRGLDILSINILHPWPAFVSLSHSIFLKFNKRQGHVRRTDGEGGGCLTCPMVHSFLYLDLAL